MSQPHPLFRRNIVGGEHAFRYAVTGDGKRFVAIVGGQDTSPLVLVQNWTMQIKNP